MSESEEQQPRRARPTRAELAEATGRLLAEIDAAFASDRWAIGAGGLLCWVRR